MEAMDPYAELGIERTASEAEVRAAYRRRAKETHPDQRPDDQAACGNAYRAIERIYEMNRVQCDLAARPYG